MTPPLTSFYLGRADRLYADRPFRRAVLRLGAGRGFASRAEPGARRRFDRLLAEHAAEAEQTLRLLRRTGAGPRDAILEAGAGLGLVHGWLALRGWDVTGIEPSRAGHGGYHAAARRMFRVLRIAPTRFRRLRAERAAALGRRYDVVVSLNVLEHVRDVRAALAGLRDVLKPGGVMIHSAPNYAVPYEPHFGRPLLPFAPRLAGWFVPGLRRDALWRGLNFVTAPGMERIGRGLGLRLTFARGELLRAVGRLAGDPQFAGRHPWLARLAPLLGIAVVRRALKAWPPRWATPFTCIMRRRGAVPVRLGRNS